MNSLIPLAEIIFNAADFSNRSTELNSCIFQMALNIINNQADLSDSDRQFILKNLIERSVPSIKKEFEADLLQCPIELKFGNFPKVIKCLQNYRNLKKITLGCHLISDDEFSHISRLRQITDIKLIRAATKHFQVIKQMTNLEAIHLKDYRLLEEGAFAGIGALQNVKTFKATKGEAQDQDFEEIRKLGGLETLVLSYCDKISDEKVIQLGQLSNLQVFHLKFHKQMQVTYEALGHLKARIVLTKPLN